MEELPTLRTAIMMTTFITEGIPPMPAFLTAMTKGEAFASELPVPLRRSGSV
jgi:hypothetical protein